MTPRRMFPKKHVTLRTYPAEWPQDIQSMPPRPTQPSPETPFPLVLGAGWVCFLFGAFLLGVAGVFSFLTVSVLSVAIVIATGYVTYSQGLRPDRATIAAFLFFGLIAAWYVHASLDDPTVFTGRDQGSYSTAALYLAQDGGFIHSSPTAQAFFSIYGPGKALNFPGFAYDTNGSLVPQFPLGYIVWLAAGVVLFGTAGFAVANGSAFLFGMLFFRALLLRFVPAGYAWAGSAAIALSFPFAWFNRFTLSENLAWPLFLLLCLSLVRFTDTLSANAYRLAWFTALFLALTRIEGWAFLVVTGIILAVVTRTSSRKREGDSGKHALFAALGMLAALDFFANLPFFRSLGGTLFHRLAGSSGNLPHLIAFPLSGETSGLWSVLWLYGMGPLMVIGLLGSLLLWKRGYRRELIPFALTLPALVYLVDPHISDDHPWLLRRIAFSIWPALVFTAVVIVVYVSGYLRSRFPDNPAARWFAPILSAFFCIVPLSVSPHFLAHREHAGLLRAIAPITDRFGSQDLVLVDRLANGDPWTLPAGPFETVYGKNAAYFFNPDDLDRLPLDRFERVYILVDAESALPFMDRVGQERLSVIDAYEFPEERFEYVDHSVARLPQWQKGETYGFVLEYRK